MKLFTRSDEPNAKLGVIERSSYMIGNAGTAFINTIIASFLLFYYTDVLFLDPRILGIIILVSRIFDGITDLIMGLIVDRTFSKHGRGRVWLLRMCIPFAISGILLFFVPNEAAETIKYVYVFITYNLCNAIFLTAVYVPYNAMTCNMTNDQYERGILSIFVMLGAVIGTMAVQSTVDTATKALGGGPTAWKIVISIYAVIGLICHLICFFFTKERYVPIVKEGEGNPKVNFKLEMKSLFANKYWILAILAVFFMLFSTSMLGSGGMYFAKGVLGDTAHYASFANVMTITQMVLLCGSFLIMKKFGKRNMILAGLVLIVGGTILHGLFASSLTMALVCSAIKGIGAGIAGGVIYALVADAIEYGEWKTGERAEGVGMAALTFATKIAQGFSTVLIGWLIAWGGYNAEAMVQSEKAVSTLNFMFNFVPAICCALAAVCMAFYGLDKIYPTIQKELAERRENKQ